MSVPFEQSLDEIANVCEAFGVERLELFGSAGTQEFGESSDVDFVVTFADRSSGYADRYLDLAQALEGLLDRDVDLVTERSIQNPFFERSVDDSRRVIYERRSEETTT